MTSILTRYPKFILLACTYGAAFVLYRIGFFDILLVPLNESRYASIILAGFLFSFGFTTPFAVGIFIATADTVHPLIAAPLAGSAAVISDMVLLEFIRFSFHDECHRMRVSNTVQRVKHLFTRHTVLERIRGGLLWLSAGLIIASPLPDEISMTIINGTTEEKKERLAVIFFFAKTLGILAILTAAQTVS